MSCLKKTVGLFGFVVIGGGIFLIVWTSIKLSENSSDLFTFAGFDWGEALTIITLILGCLMVIAGIFGVYGGCKKNKCCLCVYTPAIFIMSGVLLTIAIMSSIVFVQYNSQLQDQLDLYDEHCTNYQNFDAIKCNDQYCGGNSTDSWTSLAWIYRLNQNVNYGAQQYGTPQNCVIYATDIQLIDQIRQYNLGGINPTQVGPDANGKINVQSCQNLQEEDSIFSVSALMTLFEENFKCSGICQPYPYYLFSNVNNSPLGQTYGTPCFKKVVDFWNNYGVQIQAITYTGGSILFINVILVLVLCCKKEKKQGNIYTNMDYLD